MKKCSACHEEKAFDEFAKIKKNKDGLDYFCKECRRKKSQQYFEKNKAKWASYNEKYRVNNPEKAKECAKKSIKKFYETNKEKIKRYYKVYYDTKKSIVNERRDGIRKSKAMYDNSVSQSLSWHDYIECDVDGYLIVKCKYCGKKFIPTNKEVWDRYYSLNIKGTDTGAIYCSSGCKKACPVFNRKINYKDRKIDSSSREVQPELRQMCLARDNYTCQKCGAKGKTIQLHCHHIKAVAEDPIESADIDNTITYCKACHKQAHQIPGCKYHELRCA